MVVNIPKEKLRAAIRKLVSYNLKLAAEETSSDPRFRNIPEYRDFLFDEKLDEVIDKLIAECSTRDVLVEFIVQDQGTPEPGLLLEHERYKQIPKTNRWVRYDAANTNTKTQDHVHVFQGKNRELYAINRDGSAHDGSKAQIGKRDIQYLKSMGFNPPDNGILEWKTLDTNKEYVSLNLQLLLG